MSDRGTIGKFFLVPDLDKPMTLAPNAVLLRSDKNNEKFLFYLAKSEQVQRNIKIRTTPGAQPMISKTEFKKISSIIPQISEQNSISVFLELIDALIAANEDKHKNALNIRRRFIVSILS